MFTTQSNLFSNDKEAYCDRALMQCAQYLCITSHGSQQHTATECDMRQYGGALWWYRR